MYIPRRITEQIKNRLFKGKVIVLYGPRQVGKTTLVEHILTEYADKKIRIANGDDSLVQTTLARPTIAGLETYVKGYDILYIDEAQYIADVGVTLKLLHDHFKHVQVIATGSSSFELANKIIEPLTGRHYGFYLFAFSVSELVGALGRQRAEESLDERLVYGSYPEIVVASEDIALRLKEIANDYTSKDILRLDKVRNTDNLIRLLRSLALQIGSEVSYNEIGQNLGIDKETIERYVSILEQSFIVFRLEPYARNGRRALKRKRKIYFWDVGIRNALINNLNGVDLRTDKGHLFDNFIIAEFLKQDRENLLSRNFYFWRAYDGEEIDLIVEKDGALRGYECKYASEAKVARLSDEAPTREAEIVTAKNFTGFFG